MTRCLITVLGITVAGGSFLTAVAMATGTGSSEERIAHPKKQERRHRTPRQHSLKFKPSTDRGQVLSPGETPPPTTLRGSAIRDPHKS